MELEKRVELDQMASSLFFLINNPLSWMVVLVAPLITFATFFIFGSLSFLFTSTVLILSTLVFILFAKRKPKLVEKPVKEQLQEIASTTQVEEDIWESSKQKHHGSQVMSTQQKQASSESSEEAETGSYQIHHDYLVRFPDVMSENECVDQMSTTEDSEVDWPFRDKMDQSPDYSDDGSISDEDSLIEISLPGGHYVSHSHKEEKDQPNNKFLSLQQKIQLPDLTPESFFQQRSLMELLAELNEMNEEENLIEIDISMGSIKCSRFEIEA
ncbi:hypothetical protein COLO4_19617 [Corchorus olitorius]|uniref:Transmembrane protein n=1 Tax=Corchorus olitorius TaxID=93759 RepID=A0A1R3J4J6_9ROSI|nr:hypothetical protein COLO4_19617 [Corchorus olitorius]